MNFAHTLVTFALLTASPADATSQAWTGLRNGGSSLAAGEQWPLAWSPQQGLAWQRELPGYGQSAPVVWNNVVYVTAVEGPHKEKCLLLALAGKSGEVLWKHAVQASTTLPSNYAVARAAPTPSVDERGVYAFFEGGDVIAVDHRGQLLWRRSLTGDYGAFNNHHGLGSSPAQTDDSLLVLVEHRGPSYLICLDKATGRTRWKVERRSSMSWSSPLVVARGFRQLVVVSSGGAADVYDAASGERVWSLSDVSGNSIPSPTAHGDSIFLSAALSDFDAASNAARSNLRLKLNDSGQCELVWRAERALCDYASPVICGECIYYINRTGVLYCLDRQTGREHFTQRLPGPCWATPIAAGQRLYLFGKAGWTTVIESGPQWRPLAENSLWDLANPPRPEAYVETAGGHSHEPPAGEAKGGAKSGGFAAALMKNDQNNDGRLSAEELPEDQRRLLTSGDKNADGLLDKDELQRMSEEFRERRASSAADSRDPIVYGVAAADGAFFIRTGTRIYCVGEAEQQ
jgi:hypothetical protein